MRLFKESKVRWTKERCGITDSAGIKKLQNNTRLPKKSSEASRGEETKS
jgi:hypothetical protein